MLLMVGQGRSEFSSQVAEEVDETRFGFGEFEAILVCPRLQLVQTLLQLSLDGSYFFDRQQAEKSSTKSEQSVPGFMQLTIPLILRANKVTESILPWGTPISW